MFNRIGATIVVLCLSSSATFSQGAKLTDPQIAHIAYTAGEIDIKAAKQNYPMALAEADKRLLVGCRDPGRLVVIDTETSAPVADLPMSGDVDDVFFDAQRGLVFASCGEGFIDVFERASPGTWKPKEKIATAPGARTCLFVPETSRLILAVPHRGDQPAELRVYTVSP